MKICCSYPSYDTFKMIYSTKGESYACKNDLSYGSLNPDSFLIQHDDEICSLSNVIEDINAETNVEIWFNSNSACEYCDFLYILHHLPLCEVYIIDTSAPIQNDNGVLTIYTTYMIPINYVEAYKKLTQKLTYKMREYYKNVWESLCQANKQLRYVVNKNIHSVVESYFDEKILELPISELFDLIKLYGLSEDWIIERKQVISLNSKEPII